MKPTSSPRGPGRRLSDSTNKPLLLSPGHRLLNYYRRDFSIQVPLFGIPVVRVPTVEHYFHGMKVFYLEIPHGEDQLSLFQEILTSSSPNDAKRLGRSLPINLYMWELASVGHMLEGMIAKFHQHTDLREELLVTDGRDLVEHAWNKKWADGMDGSGDNLAGKCLMMVRELYINGPA